MKKIAIFIIILVMAITTTTAYAEPYTADISSIDNCNDMSNYGGDTIDQVNRTCKKCGTRTVIVYCAGGGYSIPDTNCITGSHTRPCTITNRIACVANAYCTFCGPYHYDADEFKVWDFNGHVESCYHTSTGITYNTCLYGPRS